MIEAFTHRRRANKVLISARNFLELTMPELMSCWLGTPWDFNGMASTPGGGKVACGYFVSTIMRDSGFDVHRITGNLELLRKWLLQESFPTQI